MADIRWSDSLITLKQHSILLISCADNFKLNTFSEQTILEVVFNNTTISPDSQIERRNSFKPSFVTDQSYSQINKLFNKKFPELVDISKVSGYPIFLENATQISEELKEYYNVFSSVAEFSEIALPYLLQSSSVIRLDFEVNVDISNLFIELLINYFLVIYIYSTIGQDFKAILSAYSKVYTLLNTEAEPSWNKIVKFLNTFEKQPCQVIQDQLISISPKIAILISEYKNDMDLKLNLTGSGFRKFSPLTLATQQNGKKHDEKYLNGLSQMNRTYSILVIGILLCPSEILKQQTLVDLLKQALQYGYYIPIYGNEVFNVYGELDNFYKSSGKYSKIRSVISETFNATFQTSSSFHKERRDYLRLQLKQLVQLSDDEEILKLNFKLMVSALGFARDEIVWYFTHCDFDTGGKKNKLKKNLQGQQIDTNITELMFLNIFLRKKIKSKSKLIKTFYFLQIKTKLFPRVSVLLNEAKKNPDLKLDSQILLDGIIDSMDSLLLNEDWGFDFDNDAFEQNLLFEHFKETIEVSLQDQARYISVYASISEDFLQNISGVFSSECKQISITSAYYTSAIYSIIGQVGGIIAHDICISLLSLEKYLHTRESIYFHPNFSLNLNSVQKKKNSSKKVPVEKSVCIKPGTEINLKSPDKSVKLMETQKQILKNILYSLTTPNSITIANIEFCGEKFFTAAFASEFKKFLSINAFKSTDFPYAATTAGTPTSPIAGLFGECEMTMDIKRPSVFLLELKGYFSAAAWIEGFVNVKVTKQLKAELSYQTDPRLAKEAVESQPDMWNFINFSLNSNNSYKQQKKEKLSRATNFSPSVLLIYTYWYVELLSTKMHSASIVLSSDKSILFSKASPQIHVEQYTDFTELCALCEITGPQGINFLDERLLVTVVQLAIIIKEVLAQNQDSLENLKKFWFDEIKSVDLIKKLKMIKETNLKFISFGVIMEFRKLIYKAISTVISDNNATLMTFMTAVSNEKLMSSDVAEPLADFDHVADLLGINSYETKSFFDGISKAACLVNDVLDHAIWDTLPTFFAASLWYLAVDETAIYNPTIDGLENNGQYITTGFLTLLNATRNNPQFSKKEDKELILTETVKITGTILLRMKQKSYEKDFNSKQLNSSISVLKRLIDSVELENIKKKNIIPYFFLESVVGDLAGVKSLNNNNLSLGSVNNIV
ncbi:hypothetical protein HK099_007382 [Clydaea vesicula]|uniref:Uncharacterized protein n=1 Tax=Clydaea vesicula TaxID=447962 RepID=A0AAD5U5I0_9FUNG|nr:hypothetical protein HK099_007382 [Clydaea vesicula]